MAINFNQCSYCVRCNEYTNILKSYPLIKCFVCGALAEFDCGIFSSDVQKYLRSVKFSISAIVTVRISYLENKTYLNEKEYKITFHPNVSNSKIASLLAFA